MKELTAWLELMKPSKRKIRLFACALARHPSVWPLLTDESSRRCVRLGERVADKMATWEEMHTAYSAASWDRSGIAPHNGLYGIDIAKMCCSVSVAGELPGWIANTPQCPSAAILAMIAGPWSRQCERCDGSGKHVEYTEDTEYHGPCSTCHGHGVVSQLLPTLCGSECKRCGGDGKAHGSDRPFEWTGPGTYPGPCPMTERILQWDDGTVPRIARHIYNERAWELMPVLADALEDAGIENNHGRRQLSEKDCQNLPDGVLVEVTWSGGDGPDVYRINKDKYGSVGVRSRDTSCVDYVHSLGFVGNKPLTEVYLLEQPNPILEHCRAVERSRCDCSTEGLRQIHDGSWVECAYCESGIVATPAHRARGDFVIDLILGKQ